MEMPNQGAAVNFLRDEILENYRWSKQEHESSFCEQSYLLYRLYKNYTEARLDPDDYHSNISIPVIFPIVETAHAYLMAPWSSSRELANVDAKQMEAMDRAPKVEAWINDLFANQIPRCMSRMSLVKKSGLIFGRGTAKYFPRLSREKSLLRRMAEMLETPFGDFRVGSRLGYQKMTPETQVWVDYVDPFQHWWTPGERFLDDAEWTFEDSYMTHSQVMAKMESGEWVRLPIQESDALGYDDFKQRREDLDQGYSDHVRAGSRKKKLHRVIEAQGRFLEKETKGSTPKYRDVIVWIVDERYLVHADVLSTFDGKPSYRDWMGCPDPGGLQGIGMIETCRDILLEINDYHNIFLDNARKVVESTLLVDPNAIKEREIYLGPGEINWVRNPGYSVKALEMRDIPQGAYETLGRLMDLVQRCTGVPDYFAGIQGQAGQNMNDTWHGMELITQLAGNRLQPLMASLDRELYQPLFEAVHQTAIARMDRSVSLPMRGNPNSPFSEIGPEDMDAIVGYSYNTKALDPSANQFRAEFIEAMGFLREIEPGLIQEGYKVDYYQLAKLMLDKFNNAKSGEVVLKALTPEQGQQMMQQAAVPPGSPLGGMQLPGRPGPMTNAA